MARTWNPNTAAWLVAQRGTTKQDVIVERLADRGQAISRSWLSRIENGAPFGDDLMAAFVDLYGSVPPPYEPDTETPSGGDTAALVSAIGDLVNQMRTLVGLATERDARIAALEAASQSNSELIGRLLEQVLQAETRLSALERTAG